MTWFARRWRNHQPKRAEKPHSKSRRSNALDGPATRPMTPLAVENSVGKPAADQAPNAGTGKRAWRTPIPDLFPVQPQGWAGNLFFPQSRSAPFRNPELNLGRIGSSAFKMMQAKLPHCPIFRTEWRVPLPNQPSALSAAMVRDRCSPQLICLVPTEAAQDWDAPIPIQAPRYGFDERNGPVRLCALNFHRP